MSKQLKHATRGIGEMLRDEGFGPGPNAHTLERRGNGLVQGIELQPGHGAHRGEFALNIYWIIASGLMMGGFNFCQRFEWFGNGRNQWFRLPTDDVALAGIAAALRADAMPFLNRFRSTTTILDAVAAGDLTAEVAFGVDPGWRDFAWGHAALNAGRTTLAVERLTSLRDFAATVVEEEETEEYMAMLRAGIAALEHTQPPHPR